MKREYETNENNETNEGNGKRPFAPAFRSFRILSLIGDNNRMSHRFLGVLPLLLMFIILTAKEEHSDRALRIGVTTLI